MVSNNKITDYSRFLSKAAKRRTFPILRKLGQIGISAPPDTINLGGGMPNSDVFPFTEATFKICHGTDITIGKDLMKVLLQYGKCNGYEPLIAQLKSLTTRLHSPPCWDSFDLIMTTGAQHGLSLMVETLVNEGDYIVVPDPIYPTVLNNFQPYSPRYVVVEEDDGGMTPEGLRAALSRWDPKESRNKYEGVPKLLFVNPTGANPSGTSLSKERRQEIYNIASEYNLIIVEDDPYYFLQFKDIEDFAPSFLSLDVDGRVLRLDSFSKIISSGLRIGYATGPEPLIDKMVCHTAVSVQHTSNLSQVLVSELLRTWGEDRFLQHTYTVRDFYQKRRDIMLAAAEEHLKGLCTWAVPAGGMFLWLKVLGIENTWEMVLKRGLEKNIIIVPGSSCFTDPTKKSSYLRASYSIAANEQLEKGMMYLADLIRDELNLKNGHKE